MRQDDRAGTGTVRRGRTAAWRLGAHRLVSRAVELSLGSPRRARRQRDADDRVVILLFHAYGIGGAIRSVFNLAEELATTRDVELVSVLREWDEALLPLPPGVPVTWLDDRRELARGSRWGRALSRVPSVLIHPDDDFYSKFTLWTDVLLLRRVRAVRSGVLLTTRPSFSALAAQVARASVVLVAQEHTHLEVLSGEMPAEIARTYGGLDAVALLTERDRLTYAAMLADTDTTILAIPNAVPRLPGTPLPPQDRRRAVVAAGRLTPQKGFDVLISAFALVTAEYPDWVLEIYGSGPDEKALSAQIERAGLTRSVTMAGATGRLSEVMAEAAVFALSSRYEGLPMVVLEAMDKQMAVVAYDCPTGPRELITDGVDGLLVAPADVEAFAGALRQVMGDVSLRARLAAGAAVQASHYDLSDIGKHWTQLFDRFNV
jgi:glycosyltransferase involved in cell wall biosynthesis